MTSNNMFEAVIGAVVLAVAVVFLVFAFGAANVGAVRGYEVLARFDRVDGLNMGADVRLSGIKVGSITGQRLDPQTFLAEVRMSIDSGIKLPADSSAQIISDGLLGSKFLAIIPGGDDQMIQPGGVISYTQSPIILENLIGQLIFGAGDKDKPKDGAAAPAPAAN